MTVGEQGKSVALTGGQLTSRVPAGSDAVVTAPRLLVNDPVFVGAALGAAVTVTGIRVQDSVGTVLGVGGFAIE